MNSMDNKREVRFRLQLDARQAEAAFSDYATFQVINDRAYLNFYQIDIPYGADRIEESSEEEPSAKALLVAKIVTTIEHAREISRMLSDNPALDIQDVSESEDAN